MLSLRGYAKKVRAELTTLCVTPMFDLQESLNQLQVEKETTSAILAEAQGTSPGQKGEEDRSDTEKAWKCWQERVNLRRRICRDMWRGCLEIVDKDVSRDEFWVAINL
ncbi:hypothetical protein BDV26DRAFT_268091 [Aspergillus bertholletiae]|uniref:Uncharacterized protein n=1 Tax=Aspergillus bertholletiae TaxID=1226010 RepID=A0A5N7B1U6_9EURO|nr:hypothetical protein BDV26DRAFT_268091 [Aspergillus bertholletiae]